MKLKLKTFEYLNITKTEDIKTVDQHPINSRNYAVAYYQTLEEVPGPLLPEKIQKHEKIANTFEKLIKFVILKSPRTFHFIDKLSSNILTNPRGSSVALETRAT